MTFKDLPKDIQKRIREYSLDCYTLPDEGLVWVIVGLKEDRDYYLGKMKKHHIKNFKMFLLCFLRWLRISKLIWVVRKIYKVQANDE